MRHKEEFLILMPLMENWFSDKTLFTVSFTKKKKNNGAAGLFEGS